MTVEEVCSRYHIPKEIAEEYEKYRCCRDEYNDADLEKMSVIMTLHDAGFDEEQIKCYMEFLKDGKEKRHECKKMLEHARGEKLEEIHLKEKEIDCLDYLRYKIKNGGLI